MSVPKNRRNVSELEFFSNAIKLREELTMLMLHDFGAKKTIKNDSLILLKNLESDDRKTILEILAKEQSNPILVKYFPLWFLNMERDFFYRLSRDMVSSISSANTIYPKSIDELDERRKLQTRAICICENMLQELYFIHRVLKIDLNKMMPIVSIINKEIVLLKGWRKSDNKFRKQLKDSSINDQHLN